MFRKKLKLTRVLYWGIGSYLLLVLILVFLGR